MSTDGAGNWVAVWQLQQGAFGSDLDILVARSQDNGLTWTDPAPLYNYAAWDAGSDHHPQLATDGAGNWVAVWCSDENLGGEIETDPDVLVCRSTDNGLTWTDPEPLNNSAATDSMAVDWGAAGDHRRGRPLGGRVEVPQRLGRNYRKRRRHPDGP